MKNKHFHYFFLFFLVSLPLVASQGKVTDYQWKLIDTYDTFKIYNGEFQEQDILAVKGETIFNHPIEKVASVFHDSLRQKEWVDRLKDMKVVKTERLGHRVVYSQGNFPWPFTDRDFLLDNTCNYYKKEKRFSCHMVSTHLPEYTEDPKKYVRVLVHDSGYDLYSLPDNRTKMVIYMRSDPRGNIPHWVTNFFQRFWPKNCIENLARQLDKKDIYVYPEIINWFKTGIPPLVETHKK